MIEVIQKLKTTAGEMSYRLIKIGGDMVILCKSGGIVEDRAEAYDDD